MMLQGFNTVELQCFRNSRSLKVLYHPWTHYDWISMDKEVGSTRQPEVALNEADNS